VTLVETRSFQILANVAPVVRAVGWLKMNILKRPPGTRRLGTALEIYNLPGARGAGDIDKVDIVPQEGRRVGVGLVELGIAEAA
jgi:hypothetical protein